MNTIVCPVDFSVCSINAAHFAAAVAVEFKSRLILFHAYEKPIRFRAGLITSIDKTGRTSKDKAVEKINDLEKKLSKAFPDLKIENILKEGISDEKILSIASSEGADLIVMGSTGKSNLEQLVLGSTTSAVIGNSVCPVLCIPDSVKYKGINKIVFATDLHSNNINAALSILTFAKHFDAEIVFVFVDDKHFIHAEEDIAKMTRKIRTHIRYNKMSGYISKNTSVTKGLEYFLKKNPADILVMFTHEKRFTGTLMNQSITQKMSHESMIPLLALNKSQPSLLIGE